MQLRLYAAPGCPFGHRAAFALREKQLAFDLHLFPLGQRPPELEAVGPRAKSPTLFVDDEVVYDSGAVLEYIEERFPEPPLMPRDPLGRARVRMVVARINDEVMPKFSAIYQAELKKDDAALEAARSALQQALGPFDASLQEHGFLAGAALSLADITLFTPLAGNKRRSGFEPAQEYGRLRAWFERMAARPSSAPQQ